MYFAVFFLSSAPSRIPLHRTAFTTRQPAGLITPGESFVFRFCYRCGSAAALDREERQFYGLILKKLCARLLKVGISIKESGAVLFCRHRKEEICMARLGCHVLGRPFLGPVHLIEYSDRLARFSPARRRAANEAYSMKSASVLTWLDIVDES